MIDIIFYGILISSIIIVLALLLTKVRHDHSDDDINPSKMANPDLGVSKPVAQKNSLGRVFESLLTQYYKRSMKDNSEQKGGCKRSVHGATHAARVFFLFHYTDLLIANGTHSLRGLANTINPNMQSLKTLLAMAPLLHDSGREMGGTDQWDHISAENTVFLLHKEGLEVSWAYVLGLYTEFKDSPDDVREFLERGEEPEYYKTYPHTQAFNELITGHVKQEALGIAKTHHSLLCYFAHLTGIADCLDIQRVRRSFDKKYILNKFRKLKAQGIEIDDNIADTLIGFGKEFISACGDSMPGDKAGNPALKLEIENSDDTLFQVLSRVVDVENKKATQLSRHLLRECFTVPAKKLGSKA